MQKHALTQGAVREIFKLFIAPLIRYKHENTSLKMFLEKLFHVDTRDITRYVVSMPFMMPGHLYLTATHKVQGLGTRFVAERQTIWVRTDSTMPNTIDVEWNGGGKQQIFCLDQNQWNSIRQHVARLDK